MTNIGVYAGSFDPITKGHQDIIERSLKILDKLVIVVMNNPNKNYWFDLKERQEMIEEVFPGCRTKLEITNYKGLLINFMEEKKANIIIRGLRAISDYEYEMGYAFINKDLSYGSAETVFLPASRDYMYLSSTAVREAAINDARLDLFVDERIEERIRKRAQELKK